MYSTLFTTTLFFALAALRVRADFEVPTIELTQCKPANLTWANTKGSYDVIIVPNDKPCGDPLVELGEHDSNTYEWPKVNVTAGSIVVISVLDGNDEEGWSGAITVKLSDDNSCLTSQGYPSPSSSSSNPHNLPSTSRSESPSATIVGAANSGLVPGNGASVLHISGAAVAFTTLGALVALL